MSIFGAQVAVTFTRLKRRVEIVHGVVKDGFCKEFAKDIESNMCDKTSAE